MTPVPVRPDPAAESLECAQAAFVLVDLQHRLLATMHECERVLANCSLLLWLAKVLNVPVILTTQYASGLGGVHPEILKLTDGLRAFDKISFGCFGDQNFVRHLHAEASKSTMLLLDLRSADGARCACRRLPGPRGRRRGLLADTCQLAIGP
jgi:hypothetical protein